MHIYHNKYCYVAHCLVSSVEPVEAAHVSVLVPVDQLAVVPDELPPGAGAGVRQQRRGSHGLGRLGRADRELALLRDLAVVRPRVDAVHHDVSASWCGGQCIKANYSIILCTFLFELSLKDSGVCIDSHF